MSIAFLFLFLEWRNLPVADHFVLRNSMGARPLHLSPFMNWRILKFWIIPFWWVVKCPRMNLIRGKLICVFFFRIPKYLLTLFAFSDFIFYRQSHLWEGVCCWTNPDLLRIPGPHHWWCGNGHLTDVFLNLCHKFIHDRNYISCSQSTYLKRLRIFILKF